MNKHTKWHQTKERGTPVGMKIILFLLNTVGWVVASALLYPVVFYFYLTKREARRASLDYLARVHATNPQSHPEPRFRHGFKHYITFAKCVLERLLLWQGKLSRFKFREDGRDLILDSWRDRKGCMLIGAHMGSFDALRVLSDDSGIKVNVVMYTAHSAKITSLIESVNADAAVNIINLKDNQLEKVLELKNCIDRGEIVALLADRMPAGSKDRTSMIPFLGEPAPFSHNPWRLAHILECRVVLFAGLRTGKKRYHCIARLFAEKITLPRKERATKMDEYLTGYAQFLEELCLMHPHQWFNFFDFWRSNDE